MKKQSIILAITDFIYDIIFVLNEGEIIDSGDTHQIFSNKELLKKAHLKAPVTTEILYALKEKGYGVDTTKISLDEIIDEIINNLVKHRLVT